MAVTNGPSKEYLEQMKAIGKQAEAAAAQAAGANMQATQAQKAQAAMAASMAQRTRSASGTSPYSYKPGDPMAGVSAGTRAQLDKYQAGYTPSAAVLDAQNALAGIQGQKPGAYTPSAAVIQAQNMLAQIQNNKPQGYNSKYAPQLEQILAEIQNPQDFKWDFNGDELFQTYADMYNRKGQQAMMNAIGNATALTGGYGNSYATQVGQQTYDEYMNDLFNVGMDLRDRAYQVHRDKQGDLLNRYNVLQNADQTDYGRHRDTVGDWQNELGYWTNQANAERNFDYGQHRDQVADWQTMLDYYTGRADTERNFDYGTYADMLNYWANMAGMENKDYWNYEDLAWDKEKLALQLAAKAAAAGGASGGGGGGGGGGRSSGSGGGTSEDPAAALQSESNLQEMIDALAMNQAMGVDKNSNVTNTQLANEITKRLAALSEYTGQNIAEAIGNPVMDYKKFETEKTMNAEPIGNTDRSTKYESQWKPNTLDYKKKTKGK